MISIKCISIGIIETERQLCWLFCSHSLLEVVTTTTLSAADDDKVVNMTIFPFQWMYVAVFRAAYLMTTLQWRHNERDGVSNHQRLHCLLNCWFRRRSNKTSKLTVTVFVWGIHRWPMNSLKGPVRRKMFPFDDVIMKSTLVEVMAWCCQTPSHYLNQCWPRSPTLHWNETIVILMKFSSPDVWRCQNDENFIKMHFRFRVLWGYTATAYCVMSLQIFGIKTEMSPHWLPCLSYLI